MPTDNFVRILTMPGKEFDQWAEILIARGRGRFSGKSPDKSRAYINIVPPGRTRGIRYVERYCSTKEQRPSRIAIHKMPTYQSSDCECQSRFRKGDSGSIEVCRSQWRPTSWNSHNRAKTSAALKERSMI